MRTCHNKTRPRRLERPLAGPFRWLLAAAAVLLLGANLIRADEFDILRVKWRDILTGGTSLDLGDAVVQNRLGGIASTANSYWSTLDTSPGRTYLWSDAARANQSEDITTSCNRLRAMALAWATRGCSLETNAALAADILSGLDWLYANKYNETRSQYDNWWDWVIGTPQHLNNTAVLMWDALVPEQITNYCNAIDKFTPAVSGTGANRTDTALVVAIRGILGRNAAKLAAARDGLSPVFPYVTSGDGFYTDGSFIQHTRHPYTGSYGSVLIDGLSKLMWLLDSSTWQVTDSARANVFRWIYDSYEPIIYKGATFDNLRGRAISRLGSTDHSAGAGNMSSILQIAQFAPEQDALAFKRMLKYWIQADTFRNFTNNVPLNLMPQTRALMGDTNILPRGELIGHYRFPCMDRVAHLRPGFGFALSMSSSRIYTYECINTENLHGWFTGDGMTTLYNGDLGQFSGNYWATIDPYHLPGTTVDQTVRADGSGESTTTGLSWVGGASLTDSGVAGMALDAQASSLVARKSWFLFDNEIVCLGAGITCNGTNAVHTTVENRKLPATATNEFNVGGIVMPASTGWSSNLAGVSWCALAGAGGYFFPGGQGLSAVRESRTNTWYAINQLTVTSGTTNPVSENFLAFWLDHGVKPANAVYSYVLLPNFSPTQTAAYASAPDILVLSNSTSVQAVREATLGLTAANFWNNGTNSVDFISVNGKASIIIREASQSIEVSLSDPTQTNTGVLAVTLDRAATWLVSAGAGVTVQQFAPQIRFTAAVSGTKGKNVRVVFSTDSRNPNPTWDADPGATNAQDGSGLWDGAATNWWNGVENVAWNDAASPIATFGNGGGAGTVTLAGDRRAHSLVFGPVSSGAYALAGSGPMTITGSGITAGASAALNVPLVLEADQVWTLSPGSTLSFGGVFSAPAPVSLALAGEGMARLAASSPQLPSNLSRLSFNDNVSLEIVAHPETVSRFELINGVSAMVMGTGALMVSGQSDFKIGGTASGAAQSLDLSGLAAFAYTGTNNTFSVGGQTSAVGSQGVLRLATNSVITAGTFAIQNVLGSTSAQSSGALYLGNTNSINADSAAVGLVRDNGTLQFSAGIANPMLTVRGTDGFSPAGEWRIATRSSSYFSASTGIVDLVSGVAGTSVLDARISSLKIADEAYNLTTTASLNGAFRMGGGWLDVTNILLGMKSSVATQSLGIVNATFSQTNGGAVRVQTLTLGDRAEGNTGTINATYTLNGGSLQAQSIQPGRGTAARVFNWTDGTIRNYDTATDLAITLPVVTLGAGGLHSFEVDASRTATVNAGLAGAGGLSKRGPGTLILAATNDYTELTSVSAGALLVSGILGGTNAVVVENGALLGGGGLIKGPVSIRPGATLSPGFSIGTLTISNDLTLAGGLAVELDKSLAQSNDFVFASGVLTNSGTGPLSVSNRGSSALAVGDRFLLFNKPLLNGASLGIAPGGGVLWSNRLALDGSILVASLVNTTPVNVEASAVAGTLSLSWPADHTGWRLEAQTNALNAGLSTNWFAWPGSAATNRAFIPVNPANPSVFYRLVYP